MARQFVVQLKNQPGALAILAEELASRGYTDQDLMKVAGRNVLRVMREAERVAAR